MIRFFSRLGQGERGVAVTELALTAPVLALLVMGVIDISNGFSRKLSLEQGAQRAIEKVMQTTEDTTPDATLKSEAAIQANVTEDKVTVRYRSFCDAVENLIYDTPCSGTQKESNYLTVTVRDDFRPMFPTQFVGMSQDGAFRLSVSAGMRIQ